MEGMHVFIKTFTFSQIHNNRHITDVPLNLKDNLVVED